MLHRVRGVARCNSGFAAPCAPRNTFAGRSLRRHLRHGAGERLEVTPDSIEVLP
jgi:hypothetical protein